MILVLGNSAKKVELKDLEDVVYYKQQKSYNDSDHERSLDLKREIAAGRLIILKQDKESQPTHGDSFVTSPISVQPAPEPTIIEKEVIVEKEVQVVVEKQVLVEKDDSKLDLLLEKILSLEGKMSESTLGTKDGIMAQLMETIDNKFNLRLEEIRGAKAVEIPERVEPEDSGVNSKIDMLIDLIKSGSVTSGSSRPSMNDYSPSSADEVYVPNIKVEDVNAQISLKTRVIESGDQVSSALDALKALKSINI